MVHAYVNTSWRVKDSEILGKDAGWDKWHHGDVYTNHIKTSTMVGTTPTFGEPMTHYMDNRTGAFSHHVGGLKKHT